MRQVKFIKDFDFNTTGGANGKVSASEGKVASYSDDLADKLVNHWEAAIYHDVRPQETKAPKQKAVYTVKEKGAGWYAIVDADGDEVDKIRGEKKATDKVEELNNG